MRLYSFDKGKADMMKCVLPVVIVLHHCATKGFEFIWLFRYLSVAIVAFFFCVSGYGLMHNFLVKGDRYLEGFMQKRVRSVAVPYLLSLVLYLTVRVAYGHFDILEYFRITWFNDWLPYSWFMFVIFLAYTAFYLIFRCKCGVVQKLLMYLGFQIAYALIMRLCCAGNYLYASFIGVSSGMTWRLCEDRILKVLENWVIFIGVLSVAISGVSVFMVDMVCKSAFFACLHLTWVLFPLFLSVLFFVTLSLIPPCEKNNRLVSNFLKISVYFYLLQYLAMFIVLGVLGMDRTPLALLLIFLVDMLIGAGVYMVEQSGGKLIDITIR